LSIFSESLASSKYESNIVIKIGSTYFAQKDVSGVSIDAENIGLVLDANINPEKYDILNAKTNVSGSSFSLLDKDGIVTEYLGESLNYWIDEDVSIYVGFSNVGLDFSAYELIATGKIKGYTKKPNAYSFKVYNTLSDLLK